MKITFACPECQTQMVIDPTEPTGNFPCPACEREITFAPSESVLAQNMVDICPRCEKSSFYIQKDFNQKLGLGIVIFFALLGLIFVWMDRPIYFYISLGAGVGIDFLLYLILPELTVCYACKTAFRNARLNPNHKPFDLHIADHYDGRSQG